MTAPVPWSPSSFTGADPAYLKVRMIRWAIYSTVFLLISLIPLGLKLFGLGVPSWLLTTPLLALVLALWDLRIMRRQVKALGYLEREADLVVRSGVMWRKQLVIPYGRMQYVEVNSGPLERRYGLCQLTLNTAGSSATAHVYGLPEALGEALRERLVAAGEEQML
ncbi:PH domain-containing protein [Glutamicibacter uratoxydans]|nr:PH domain-containing protein [Glutamicibacter uratoxydans]